MNKFAMAVSAFLFFWPSPCSAQAQTLEEASELKLGQKVNQAMASDAAKRLPVAAAFARVCAQKQEFFRSALISGQGIKSLLDRLVTDSDDVIILGEEHFTQAMDVEPEIVALLFERYPKLNCVFMEFPPGNEKKMNSNTVAGTPYQKLFEQANANGQAIIFVDEFNKMFLEDPARHVSVRNKGMASEIRRHMALDPSGNARCTGGIMIVGKGHVFGSWANQSILPIQFHLNRDGLKTKTINLLPFPPKAKSEGDVPNDAQLFTGDCRIEPKELTASVGYLHPILPEDIPYYRSAGLFNDFDATVLIPP